MILLLSSLGKRWRNYVMSGVRHGTEQCRATAAVPGTAERARVRSLPVNALFAVSRLRLPTLADRSKVGGLGRQTISTNDDGDPQPPPIAHLPVVQPFHEQLR